MGTVTVPAPAPQAPVNWWKALSPLLAIPVMVGFLWLITDTRDDAVIVQLSATGQVIACWELERCDVDVDADRVSWTCGKYTARRHVTAPFRITEDRNGYEILGLDWGDKRCIRESGKR